MRLLVGESLIRPASGVIKKKKKKKKKEKTKKKKTPYIHPKRRHGI